MAYTTLSQSLRDYLEEVDEQEAYQIPVLFDEEFIRLEKQLNQELSLEDNFINGKKIKDFIIRVLKWIKDSLIKLYNYLKTKLGTWIKSKNFKKTVAEIDFIRQSEFLSREELADIIYNGIRSTNNLSLEADTNFNLQDIREGLYRFDNKYKETDYNFGLLFDNTGRLRNIQEIVDRSAKLIEDLNEGNENYLSSRYDFALVSGNTISYELEYRKVMRFVLGGEPIHNPFNGKDSSFFDHVDFYRKVESFEKDFLYCQNDLIEYKNYILASINEHLNTPIREDDKNGEMYKNEISRFNLMLFTVNIPITFMMQFSRLISEIVKTAFSEKYITTDRLSDVSSTGELYHASLDGNLTQGKKTTILKARIPLNGFRQFLPERISFSPSPEQCFYGIPNHIDKVAKQIGDKTYSAKFYLYRGIPIKSKTRYLKEELVRSIVDIAEWSQTNEICVYNEISLEFVSEVEYIFTKEKYLNKYVFISMNYIKSR